MKMNFHGQDLEKNFMGIYFSGTYQEYVFCSSLNMQGSLILFFDAFTTEMIDY